LLDFAPGDSIILVGMAAEIQGVCCICGSLGRLPFEHVPPRAAFNEHRVLTLGNC
jgi:hypothetical protein